MHSIVSLLLSAQKKSVFTFFLSFFFTVGLSIFLPLFSCAQAPTAQLTGGGNLCAGGTGDTLTFTFTGTGPFTFVYEVNGVAQAPITTPNTIYKIYVTPTQFTQYELVSVSDPNGPGTVSGIAEFFVFVTSSASLPADQTYCNQVSTTVLVNVTGTAPFTVIYSINDVVQPPVMVDEGPIPIPANINQTTEYQLISIESPGCLRPLTDSMIITINHPPTTANLQQNCNALAQNYTLSFDVVNGTPPYTLVSGSGAFVGNTFTSAVMPANMPYSVVFHDANNCGDVTVAGPTICNCVSQAGLMDPTPLDVCEGATATAVHSNTAVLDNNDLLAFILHTQAGAAPGAILAWNTAPVFDYQPAYQLGVTYYISAIVGNDAGNGQVDISDICAKVAPGTPVTWHAFPKAVMGPDEDICLGDSLKTTLVFSGTPPFGISGTFGGAPFSINNLAATFEWGALPAASTRLILTSVSDAFCTQATSDTLRVTVHAPPVMTVQTLCDYLSGTYRVELSLTQGDTATLVVAGGAGVWDAAQARFLSDPIPFANPYQFWAYDQFQCDTFEAQGPPPCPCNKNAGILSGNLNPCFGATFTVSAPSGVATGPGDALSYVLTTGPDPATWTVLRHQASPDFTFVPGQVFPGITYYVAAVAGVAGPGGTAQLADVCVDYSNAIPVVWKPEVTAVLSGSAQICSGSSAVLTIQLSGAADYTFDINAGSGVLNVQNDTAQVVQVLVSPASSTTYLLANLTGDGCPGIGFGNVTIGVNPTPNIVGLVQICDVNNTFYTLQFGIDNGPAGNPPYVVSGVAGSFIADTVFVTQSAPSGTPYGITVSGPGACSVSISGSGVCECVTDAGSISVVKADVCTSESVTVSPDGNAVLDGNDALVYVLCSDPFDLPQSILAVNDQPEFSFFSGLNIETTYYLLAVAGDVLANGEIDYSSPCLSTSNFVDLRFHTPPTAAIPPLDTAVCRGDQLFIPIVFTGNGPFSVSYVLNGVELSPINTAFSNFFITASNVQEPQLFELLQVTGAYCEGTVSGSAQVSVLEPPKITLFGSGSACPGDSVLLQLNLENADSAQVQIISSLGELMVVRGTTGSFSFAVAPAADAQYSLGTVLFYGNPCPGIFVGDATVTIAPISANATLSSYNGYNLTCYNSQDGRIDLSVSGGGGDYTYQWTNGQSVGSQSGLAAGPYGYTVTDQYGCATTGSAELIAPEAVRALYAFKNPTCYGYSDGFIVLDSIQGGLGPYEWAINDLPGVTVEQAPQTASFLRDGMYSLALTDANGCVADTLLTLHEPQFIDVALGPDRVISFGDSLILDVYASAGAIARLDWSPLSYVSDPGQLDQRLQPLSSATLRLVVTDTAGCTGSDEVEITVLRNQRLFTPNILNTEADDANALFTLYAGPEVQRIKTMQVLNRWGELLFERSGFLPNDPSLGWDARFQDRYVPPGVYVYWIEIEYVDGRTEILKGDITVFR